jgi:hypothetical protein
VAGERRTEYRLIEADGRPGYCVHDSDEPHDLGYYDRLRPNTAPHRQQRRTVTTTPWEDLPDGD